MPSIILEIEIEKMLRTYRFYKRKEILDIRENSRFGISKHPGSR